MDWSRGYLPSVSCCYILVKVPSPYPCPSVTNHRLAPLMEAGDTSGVSYGALTLSLSHGARENTVYYNKTNY